MVFSLFNEKIENIDFVLYIYNQIKNHIMNKFLTFLVGILFISSYSFSQYYYLPAATPGNPGGLNGDSEYPSGSGLDPSWTVILGPSQSTPVWSSTETIPFNFDFNGSPVTQYKVSSTGILTFSTSVTAVPGAGNAAIPDPAIPDNSILVWGIEGSGSNDNICTKTFGTAGSQQHWIFFTSYTAGSWSYWSIVLEEGSNKIYIVDQRHSSAANPLVTAGIQIDATTATMVSGSPQLANVAGSSALPDDNHYYEFIYGSQSAIDASGIAVTTFPYLILANAPFTISGEITNLGSNAITSMDVNYSINGGAAVTQSLSNLTINTYDNYPFDHATTWNPTTAGTYDVAIWASNINGASDMDPSNDTINGVINVFTNFETRRPMLEVFTSSTCGPCVQGNINLANVLSNYPDLYTLIKYQMSWPGNGDPYFTDEGYDRRVFYGVNSVPRLEIDGGYDSNPNGFTAQEFDDYAAIPSFTTLTANYSVGGQTVDVNISIDPLENMSSNNLSLHTGIFEYLTYNNASSNGEIEFANVMKKMLPNASGYVINPLQAGVQQTYDFSYTFQGNYTLPADANSPVNHMLEHTVEDFNNLGVAVWVQDDVTKEILQSTTASLVTDVNEDLTSLNKFMVFPNPSNEIATIAFMGIQGNDIDIKLVNLLGEVVLHESFTSSSTLDNFNIDVSSFSNGVYNVVITSNDKISTQQLQILR